MVRLESLAGVLRGRDCKRYIYIDTSHCSHTDSVCMVCLCSVLILQVVCCAIFVTNRMYIVGYNISHQALSYTKSSLQNYYVVHVLANGLYMHTTINYF